MAVLASRIPERTARSVLALLNRRELAVAWTNVAFAASAALLACGVARHEPWFDEAQAWLLSRDLGLWDLLARHLRYEGTPGLWHTLLHLANRAGAPSLSMSLLGAGSAALGILLLLRFSFFPAVVRMLLPFTYFLAYQYAVVARSYNLAAPILFAIAIVHSRRRESPISYALLLCLLSQTSLHGFLIACGLAAVEGVSVIRSWKDVPRKGRTLGGGALLIAGSLFIVWQLLPPPDLAFAPSFHFGIERLAVFTGDLVHDSLAESPFLSELAMAVSLWWMWKRRALSLFVVPGALLACLAAFRYSNVWHQGMFWLVWVFALWISFDPERDRIDTMLPEVRRRWSAAVTAAVLAVCVVQITWTARTLAYDVRLPYSGSRALARYLRTIDPRGRRLNADGFKDVAVNLYFPRNVFANVNDGRPEAFWHWSKTNALIGRTGEAFAGNPELVVLSVFGERPRIPPGYRLVRVFPGGIYWKNRVFEADHYALIARDDAADALTETTR